MPSERDKDSENPYDSPLAKSSGAKMSAGCLAATVALPVACLLVAYFIRQYFIRPSDGYELVGLSFTPVARWTVPLTMLALVIIALVTYRFLTRAPDR